MSEVKLDNPNGSAGPDSPKPPVVPGLDVTSDNVEGLKKMNASLLADLKKNQARLDALEAEKNKALEDDAKKRGDYETLLSDHKKKLEIAAAENKQLKIAAKSITEYGLIDPDYVVIIAGQVADDLSNLPEIMESLKVKKPWLFTANQIPTAPQVPKVDTSKATATKPGHTFTNAEIELEMKGPNRAEYWKANGAEITKQMKQGLIK